MDALNLDIFDIKLLMVIGLFLLGVLTLLVGIILLITRSAGKEVRTLATQTAKLAQKGIAEDVAGIEPAERNKRTGANICRHRCLSGRIGFPADGRSYLACITNLWITIFQPTHGG